MLDVTQDEDVKSCIQHILQSKGKIDLLVNNAGHGLYSPIEDASLSDIQHQFDVNVFGAIRLIQAVLPSMRQQKSGMIINMSSVVGHISMPLFGYYAGSKHALEAISDALRMEVEQFGIKTVIIEPGMFKTNFREVALNTINMHDITKDYDPLVQKAMTVLSAYYEKAPSPIIVAKLIGKITESKTIKRRYVIGKGSKFFMFSRKYFGYALLDKVLMKIFGAI